MAQYKRLSRTRNKADSLNYSVADADNFIAQDVNPLL